MRRTSISRMAYTEPMIMPSTPKMNSTSVIRRPTSEA